MKSVALVSVAAAFLAAGLVAAAAQSDQDANRKGDPAQSAPSAQGTVQPRERATTGVGSEQDRSPTRDRKSDPNNRAANQQSGSNPKQSEQSAAGDKTKASKRASHREKNNETKRAAERRSREDIRQAGDRDERNQRVGRNRNTAERSESSSRESRHKQRSRDQRAGRNRQETTGGAFGASERNRNAESEHGSRHDEATRSEDQRARFSARLSDRIDRMDIRPIPRTRISVSVGRRVPRSIRLYNLPSDVVRIYPRFRGDHFVLVEDEIVVVDPDTRHIVAVLPRQSRHAARETTGMARSDERLELTPEQRRVIRTTVMEQPTCHYEQRLDFFLFMPVPHTVQVCEFPHQVVQEVPEVEQYRYVVHNDEVVVVDPNRDRVVEVIR